LLLTGSRSNVAPHRYGADGPAGPLDEARDEVALTLAAHMIEAGKPVFGICRGLQELNVLFGGTLAAGEPGARHHGGNWSPGDYASLFDLRHDVALVPGGVLARTTGEASLSVTSVHEQVIDRLGYGLAAEAHASDDGVIEAIAARPCGADVLAVQWHPEWDVSWSRASQRFFALMGEALGAVPRPCFGDAGRGGARPSLRGH
jgi:putative glutamine amidotransferase